MNESGAGREPVITAGAITAVASAILAAFWAVAADLHWLVGLTVATQALVTGAIIAVVALVSSSWARGKVTPVKNAVLSIGTRLRTPEGKAAVVTKSQATE